MSLRHVLAALALLTGAGGAAAMEGGRLVPPPGYLASAGNKASGTYACPQMPAPFTGALDFPSKYTGDGKSKDKLNEGADAEYKEKTRPVTEMEKGITKVVGAYMQSGKVAALDCALGAYEKWADAGALLGPAANHTGMSVRKWALAALSSAYLRLKFSSSQPLDGRGEQAKKIEAWLSQIGDKVMAEWDPNVPAGKLNNHYYWSAWAGMATAVVTNRRDLFDWSLKIYDRFTTQVDKDGFLPNELGRKTRALGYHLFAIPPLAMLAAFGEANGIDLAGRGNGALKRLGDRTLEGYENPKVFESKAGVRQVLEGMDEASSKLAWLEPYCATVDCDGKAREKLQSKRPFKNSRLGGDVTAVFARVEMMPPSAASAPR